VGHWGGGRETTDKPGRRKVGGERIENVKLFPGQGKKPLKYISVRALEQRIREERESGMVKDPRKQGNA